VAPNPVSLRALGLALLLGALPGIWLVWHRPDGLVAADIAVAGAGLAACLLLAVALPARLRAPGSDRAHLALALAVAAVPPLLASCRLDGPLTNDERSHLFQAALIGEGSLTEPQPQPKGAWRRRQVYEDEERGVRYSKYSPGPALALAPAELVGWPHLSVLLAGLGSVLLAAAIARAVGCARPGLAALLLAASPFFLLAQTSFQSEVFAAPAALAGFLSLLCARSAATPATALRWRAALGACTGWVLLCRPLTGTLLALALGLGLLRGARPVRCLAAAICCGLPLAGAFLLYNAALTGSALTLPYHLYALRFGPFTTSGEPLDVYGNGNVTTGLELQAGAWSIAFAGVLGLVAPAFWGLWRLRAQDGGAALVFAAGLPAAYAFHWFAGSDEYLGPLYCYESLGLLVVGWLVLLRDAPARATRAMIVAALLMGPVAAGFRWPHMRAESALRSAPEIAAREAPAGAVIFLLPVGGSMLDDASLRFWTPSRPPRDRREPVILRALPALSPDQLLEQAGLSGRPTFRFEPGGNGAPGRLVPLR
jgi:hypothetical protein